MKTKIIYFLYEQEKIEKFPKRNKLVQYKTKDVEKKNHSERKPRLHIYFLTFLLKQRIKTHK